jgi:hypothetical protein
MRTGLLLYVQKESNFAHPDRADYKPQAGSDRALTAILWIAAFLLFATAYGPMLYRTS